MRRNRAQWETVLSRYEQSGLSAEAFCAREAINTGTMLWWRGKLKRGKQPAQMVRVVSATATQRNVHAMVCGDAIRFEGAEPHYVASVISELRARC
jgi:hypothetical protein